MKKLICVLLSVIVVASLITVSVSAIDVPPSATPLTVDTYLRFCFAQYPYDHWYSGEASALLDDWQDGTLNDQSPIVYPAAIFSNGFATYDIQDTTTYYMQYELTTQDTAYFYALTTNAAYYKLVPSRLLRDIFGNYTSSETVATLDPRNFGLVGLSEISREISTTVTQVGSQTYRIGLAFSTKADVEPLALSAIMFTSIGVLDEADRLEFVSFQAWTDENLSIYEDLVAGRLDSILGAVTDLGNDINDAADQAHDDAEDIKDGLTGITGALDDVKDTLVGEPIEDNTGFSEELIELKEIEDSIQDAVFNNMNIDGSSIAIDGDVLTNIKHYLVNKFNPQDYESVAGVQITRVFEAFMPYMGIVVWFNLALGLALGFIRGRTHA